MYGDLQRQLNSDDISGYLFSAGVLTMIDLGKINNIMFNNHMKVTELLDAVARAINRDTSNFSKFLDSLDKVLSYRAIASRARAKLGTQPSIQQPSVGSSVHSSVGLGPPSGEVPVQEQILKPPSQPQPSELFSSSAGGPRMSPSNDNVIDVDEAVVPPNPQQNQFHPFLENCWSVAQPERDHFEFKKSVSCSERCLGLVPLFNLNLPITTQQVQSRKPSGTTQSLQRIIHSRKGIGILTSDGIQLAIIHAKSQRAVFLS
eukprot:Em0009g1086a